MKSSHFLVFLRHRYISIDEYIVVNMDINIIKKLHQTIHVHVCTNGTKTMSTYYQKKKIHCQLKEKILEKNTELFI